MNDPRSQVTGSIIAPAIGRLISIAFRERRRAPMIEVAAGEIAVDAGLIGDHKGLKSKKRAITVLAIEDWQAALAAVRAATGANATGGTVPELPWTTRRANLLVEGLRLPRAAGAIVRVGPVELEVTAPTVPCKRMDEVQPGLLKALHGEWRGGVTARVLQGGAIKAGDVVEIVASPPERPRRRLP